MNVEYFQSASSLPLNFLSWSFENLILDGFYSLCLFFTLRRAYLFLFVVTMCLNAYALAKRTQEETNAALRDEFDAASTQ